LSDVPAEPNQRDAALSGLLLPKEHGAYAELAFPLVTGLALATPTWPAVAIGLAAVALFLAHEPLAVAVGIRGGRLKEKVGSRAIRQGIALLGGGGILGAAGLLGAGPALWPAIIFPLAAAAALVPLVSMGRQKTLLGEFVVVTAFSTLVLPMAAASGADPARALGAALVWWVSFGLGTLEVHAIKARHKKGSRIRRISMISPAMSGVVVLLALAALAFSGSGQRAWEGVFLQLPPLALLPPATGTLALALLRVNPKHLMRVGWTLVGANTLTLIILLLP